MNTALDRCIGKRLLQARQLYFDAGNRKCGWVDKIELCLDGEIVVIGTINYDGECYIEQSNLEQESDDELYFIEDLANVPPWSTCVGKSLSCVAYDIEETLATTSGIRLRGITLTFENAGAVKVFAVLDCPGLHTAATLQPT
jgi:hypothetical protein